MFIKIKYSLHLFSYILILLVLDGVQELVLKTDKNQGDFNAGVWETTFDEHCLHNVFTYPDVQADIDVSILLRPLVHLHQSV